MGFTGVKNSYQMVKNQHELDFDEFDELVMKTTKPHKQLQAI